MSVLLPDIMRGYLDHTTASPLLYNLTLLGSLWRRFDLILGLAAWRLLLIFHLTLRLATALVFKATTKQGALAFVLLRLWR